MSALPGYHTPPPILSYPDQTGYPTTHVVFDADLVVFEGLCRQPQRDDNDNGDHCSMVGSATASGPSGAVARSCRMVPGLKAAQPAVTRVEESIGREQGRADE